MECLGSRRAGGHGPTARSSRVASVDVKADYGRVYHCRISQLVAGRALVLEVRPPLMTVIQTYVVEPTPGGSRIRHALEISGPLAGLTRLIGLPRAYQRRLGQGSRQAHRHGRPHGANTSGSTTLAGLLTSISERRIYRLSIYRLS